MTSTARFWKTETPAAAAAAAVEPSVDEVYDAAAEVVRPAVKVRPGETVIDASLVPAIVAAITPVIVAQTVRALSGDGAQQAMVDALWGTLTDADGAGSDLTLRRPWGTTKQERAEGHLGVIGEGSIDVPHLADVALRTVLERLGVQDA